MFHCGLRASLRLSVSGTLWNRVLACVSLSDASSAFTVFSSKCHIRLPRGWQRSLGVQLVRLCLDRLRQTFFLGAGGPLSHTTSTPHVYTNRDSSAKYKQQQQLFLCVIIKTDWHNQIHLLLWEGLTHTQYHPLVIPCIICFNESV